MYEDTKKIFEDLDISVDPRAKLKIQQYLKDRW